MNNLIDLRKIIEERKDEKRKILIRLNEINKEIRAAEIILRITKKDKNKVMDKTSGISEYQGLINSLKYKKHKKKMTQLEAIDKIAKVIGNKNGSFKLNKVKKIMVAAGFFKTPRNANNILYTIMDRNRDKFEKVEPGVYKVIGKENSKGGE